MAVQSGRRSQTLNKDLKGCKEGCGEEEGGEGAAMVIILVVLKKKGEKKTHGAAASPPSSCPTLDFFFIFFCRAKFGNIVECHAKFAAQVNKEQKEKIKVCRG